MQLGYLNWWLRYDDAGFTWHVPLLGKARSYRYEEVTEIRRGSWQTAKGATPGYEIIIRCGEKHFIVSPDQNNYRDLLQLLSQRVPRERWKREDRSKPDPYNHNVPNGWRNLFLSLILPAIFLSLLIFEIVRYHLGYFNRDEFRLCDLSITFSKADELFKMKALSAIFIIDSVTALNRLKRSFRCLR